MTYLQILQLIKDVALAQPNINSVVREFTDLNREDARYSAVVIQDRDGQREMINGQDYITYTWHLGYVDRLTYDEGNRDDIYSTGMVVINNIVAELRERFFPELEVTVPDRFTTFNQRFTASCAGVYVVLAVNMAISDCADYQTDIYDKYQARFTENGHYHYVPEGRPVDEIDIYVDVPECKEEIERTVTINMNGQTVVTPPEGTVFSAVTVNTSVHPSSSLSATYTSNGTYSESGEWKNAEITVDVHPSDTLIETITSNGTVNYSGEWTDASITVDVHPTVSLSETYTSNGTYNISGEYSGGEVTVAVPVKEEVYISDVVTSNGVRDFYPPEGKTLSRVTINTVVHPSTSLTRTYTSNGTYSESGDWRNAEITVSVPVKQESGLMVNSYYNHTETFYAPEGKVWNIVTVNTDVHPSDTLIETITSNGTVSYSGEWTDASITVDVHPSVSLSETYTSNGTYSISGEYNGGTVAVSVPQKTEIQRTVTINMNGQTVITPPAGDVFSAVTVNTSVHPSVSLSETYTSNGTYNISGEYRDGEVTVDVHPSASLVETITSNGTVNYSGEWKDASITVDVHPSASLSETYTSNGTYNISGEYNGGVVTVAVSGAGKPEESLVQAITSNGSFHYDPTAGSVFSSADITVSVHPSASLSETYTSNGTYSISGEYNGGTVAVSVPTTSVLTVTQSQYDSILVKDSNTIYLING